MIMKNLLKIYSFLFLMFIVSSSFAQNKGTLILSTTEIKPKQDVSLTYQSAFKDDTDLKAYLVYLTPKLDYYKKDIALTAADKSFKGKVNIPDSAVLVMFSFKSGEKVDGNDGLGYVYPLKNDMGTLLPGTNKGMALMYSGLGNYLGGMKDDKANAIKYSESELALYPNNRAANLPTYYSNLIVNKDTEKAVKVKEEIIKSFNKMDEAAQVSSYYLFTRTDKPLADSLKTLIVTKYPKGTLASNDILSTFSREKEIAKLETEYMRLMVEKDLQLDKDMLTYYLARAYSNAKDYDKMLATLDKMKLKADAPSVLNSIAWKMAEDGATLETAAMLSKKSLDIIDDLRTNEAYLANFSNSEKIEILDGNYGSYADTYAFILFKQGNIKDALKYQEKAVMLGDFKSAEVNERYVKFLVANNDDAKAESVAKRLIAEGKATEEMTNMLKSVYLKKHSEEDFSALLVSLNQAANKKVREEMVAKMIDMKAPDFSLKNLKGETVSLASLKGKVVIVDFWATWCGPCIASFPGMQKSLDKFKDDKNVAFVFIDTWESIHDEKRTEAVTKFIESNKYTFNVLMDTEDEKDKSKYDVVSAYGVEGIPTKFVIDKAGRIRFKAVGFSGSADGIVKEISAMVDLAANPPQNVGMN
jgi:peroxiredoxin/tetratricopeptide (TPR) repeat protein